MLLFHFDTFSFAQTIEKMNSTNLFIAIGRAISPTDHLSCIKKTFTISTLLDKLRKDGYIAVSTAFTGIAAILLPGGRTLHSRLKVPVGDSLTEDTILPITGHKNSTRKLFEAADLLVIDEFTMTCKNIFLAIDRTLRDIRDNSKPFGGMTVLLSGDWRQTLPVIPRANRPQVVDETLKGKIYVQIKQN